MAERHVDDTIYRFGEFELSPRDRMLSCDGRRVALTPRMFDLLLALVQADGHLLSKETLLETVWSDAAVEEGNLNRTISALRKALGENRNEVRYIETVPKAGYRFVAPVESSNARTHVTPGPEPSPVASNSRVPLASISIAAVSVFAIAAVAYVFLSRSSPPQIQAAASNAGPIRLTTNSFDEDGAMWTNDDQIRFLRFTAVNKVESMIMNADGSGQQRAGGEIRNLRAGTWSPDGKHVVYSKEGEPAGTTFISNADGSNEQRLDFMIGPMDWSLDGKLVVFSANYPTQSDDSEILIFSPETGERTNITNHPSFDANPSFSPDGRQVIFNSDRDGNSEIYLVNVDGSGLRRLTNDPAKEAFQAFSPDGTQIVFNSNRENEKVGVYLINVNDDSPPVKLSDTRFNAEIRPGCWSHDGTRIVYTSDAGGDKFNIYTMTIELGAPKPVLSDSAADVQSVAIAPDGTHAAIGVKLSGGTGELRMVDLTSGESHSIAATENSDILPSFSPDGGSIAFANKSGGNTEIFSIRSDGTELKNLTQNAARDAGPAWSPDGSKIVFSSDRGAPSERTYLYVMNIDGSQQERLLTGQGFELTPAWSPDGKSIAYSCDRIDGRSRSLDIFTVDLAAPGSERIVVSRRYHDANPTYSPDGKRIAFASQSDGNHEIYIVNTDGTGLVRLTRNAGDDMMPAFSRDGTKVYFVSNRTGKFGLYEISIR